MLLSKIGGKFDILIHYLSGLSMTKLIGFSLFIDIGITSLFSLVLFPGGNFRQDFDTPVEEFIIVVVAAPLIETYLFQEVIISAIVKKFNHKLAAAMISALFFGLMHYYSIPYIIKAMIAGVIYALLYLAITNKRKNAFLYVWLTHAMYNLVAYIINSFE